MGRPQVSVQIVDLGDVGEEIVFVRIFRDQILGDPLLCTTTRIGERVLDGGVLPISCSLGYSTTFSIGYAFDSSVSDIVAPPYIFADSRG